MSEAVVTEEKPKKVRVGLRERLKNDRMHIGEGRRSRLCGGSSGRVYLASHLSQWQVEGLTAVLCPDCLEKFLGKTPPPTPFAVPAAEMATQHIAPPQNRPIYVVWRRFGSRWSYAGKMGFSPTVDVKRGEIACLIDEDPNLTEVVKAETAHPAPTVVAETEGGNPAIVIPASRSLEEEKKPFRHSGRIVQLGLLDLH